MAIGGISYNFTTPSPTQISGSSVFGGGGSGTSRFGTQIYGGYGGGRSALSGRLLKASTGSMDYLNSALAAGMKAGMATPYTENPQYYADKAATDVQTQGESQLQAERRSMAEMGIDPSSERYQAIENNKRIALAAAKAGASNQAYRDVMKKNLDVLNETSQVNAGLGQRWSSMLLDYLNSMNNNRPSSPYSGSSSGRWVDMSGSKPKFNYRTSGYASDAMLRDITGNTFTYV